MPTLLIVSCMGPIRFLRKISSSSFPSYGERCVRHTTIKWDFFSLRGVHSGNGLSLGRVNPRSGRNSLAKVTEGREVRVGQLLLSLSQAMTVKK